MPRLNTYVPARIDRSLPRSMRRGGTRSRSAPRPPSPASRPRRAASHRAGRSRAPGRCREPRHASMTIATTTAAARSAGAPSEPRYVASTSASALGASTSTASSDVMRSACCSSTVAASASTSPLRSSRAAAHLADRAEGGRRGVPLVEQRHRQPRAARELGGHAPHSVARGVSSPSPSSGKPHHEAARLQRLGAPHHLGDRRPLARAAHDHPAGRRDHAGRVADREPDAALAPVDRDQRPRSGGIMRTSAHPSPSARRTRDCSSSATSA